jgi:hypothetical protein
MQSDLYYHACQRLNSYVNVTVHTLDRITLLQCKLQIVALTVHYLIAAQCNRCCALCQLCSCLPFVQSLMQLASGATGGALRTATLQQYRQCVKQVAEGAEYIHTGV